MPAQSLLQFLVAGLTFAALPLYSASCSDPASTGVPESDFLAVGTWGGDDAGVIVTDERVHVHVGCTFGDMPPNVPLDAKGRFATDGTYVLRAFPVQVGPSLPAQFSGLVEDKILTLAVAVNDTVEHKVVSLGPVRVIYGREPNMGPCPICRIGP